MDIKAGSSRVRRIQMAVLAMGRVGTVTIVFFVRTTAGRQPLILS
jgi:hypothetical protein